MPRLFDILTVAVWEVARPVRRRTTYLGLATLVVSLVLFQVAFPSLDFESGLATPLSSVGLYDVAVGDADLAGQLAASPRFSVVDNGSEADLVLSESGGVVEVAAGSSVKARIAAGELAAVLSETNAQRRDRLVARNESATFILKPLWTNTDNLTSYTVFETLLAATENRSFNASGNGSGGFGGNGSATGATAINVSAFLASGVGRPEGLDVSLPLFRYADYFLVIVPFFFFSLYAAASVLREKVGGRGTPLLASPLSAFDIVAGKMLPYLLVCGLSVAVIGRLSGLPEVSLFAAFYPLALLSLGLALVVAILSKTPHDLNIILTFAFMLLFAYVFYPAMFSGLSDVALVSPLGALMAYEEGSLSAVGFAAALAPLVLSAVVVWTVGVYLFRADVLASQEPTVYKLYRAFELLSFRRLGAKGPWLGLVVGAVALIPLVVVAELYLVFLVLPFGQSFVYLLVPAAAAIEEAAKVFGVAAFTKLRFIRGGFLAGAVSGLGFYLGERLIVAFFAGDLLGMPGARLIVAASLLITLAVHALTAGIAGAGCRLTQGRIRPAFIAYFLLAVFVHAAYNVFVLWGAFGG